MFRTAVGAIILKRTGIIAAQVQDTAARSVLRHIDTDHHHAGIASLIIIEPQQRVDHQCRNKPLALLRRRHQVDMPPQPYMHGITDPLAPGRIFAFGTQVIARLRHRKPQSRRTITEHSRIGHISKFTRKEIHRKHLLPIRGFRCTSCQYRQGQ